MVDLNSYMELNSITPYESNVLLSDGSGCSASSSNPSPTPSWSERRHPGEPTDEALAADQRAIADIMSKNEGGCSELPKPNRYHVG